MVKVYVSKVEWCATHGSYVVVLKEIAGERFCSIVVKEWEAQLIGVLLNQNSQEPYKTAWLLSYLLENSDMKILRVEIQKMIVGGILAKVIYCNRKRIYTITHSPGEAVELAMRCRAPIIIQESLLFGSESPSEQLHFYESELQLLKQELEKAVKVEEYEKAAKLRDKILNIEKRIKCK